MCMGWQALLASLVVVCPPPNRSKQSGKIDRAITQIDRKIIIDAELTLELAGRKVGGRK